MPTVDYLAVLDHEVDLFRVVDILRRVRIKQHEIGELPDFDGAELVLFSQEDRAVQRTHADSIEWGDTTGDEKLELSMHRRTEAFIGIETGLNVSGEIKNPQKTIPKGIMLSALTVVLLYTLIQVTAQGVLGETLPNFKDAPLAEVGKTMIGPLGATLVVVGACFSMFGNLSGFALNMPRIIFAAARDEVILPKSLANIHARYSTPHVAIISYATLACFFACTGEFKQLAMLASASFLLIYLGVILAVIKYRIAKQDKAGAYKMPGGYFIPTASASIAVVWFLSNLPSNELSALLIFLALLSVFYLTMNFWRRKHA